MDVLKLPSAATRFEQEVNNCAIDISHHMSRRMRKEGTSVVTAALIVVLGAYLHQMWLQGYRHMSYRALWKLLKLTHGKGLTS